MASIEKLKTCVRIIWMHNGKKDRETLKDIPPTSAGIEQAKKIGEMIEQQIKMGIFDRDTTFPDSPKRAEAYFGHYIPLYTDNLTGTVAKSTYNTYTSKIKNHITPYWSKQQIAKINAEKVEKWVNHTLKPNLSTKTIKDIISLWRSIWKYWARHQQNPNDPTQYIKLSTKDADDINPFTKEEIATILAEPTNDPMLKNLWTVMLWSGLSSHELLPLAIEDLDLAEGTAYIQRGYNKVYRATKNRRRKRQIQLLPIVINALQAQIKLVQGNKPQTVTITERDHNSESQHTLHFLWCEQGKHSHLNYARLDKLWKRHLKQAKVDHRSPNHGRHTYASQVLSTGAVSAEWLADQLGHSNTEMIHKHYGKFIPQDSTHIIQQLNQALNNKQEAT